MFEQLMLWVDQTGAMTRAGSKAVRLSVVLATIVAWLSISNHCVIGELMETKSESAKPTMHCHGSQPLPSKKSNEEEMPCCKVLRATVASNATVLQPANENLFKIQKWINAEITFPVEAGICNALEEFDTGPPFAETFAESVLQRSILAHAPPVSLS